MSNHTPEPWPKDGKIQRGTLFIVPATQDGGVFEWIANRRRIVACVNALVGVPTEELEQRASEPQGAKTLRVVTKAIERGMHINENGELVLQTGKIAKLNPDRDGYVAVQLSVDGERVTVSLARILCQLLNGPPPHPTYVVDHIDRDKRNDAPENLRWATYSENLRNNGQSDRGTSATARRILACVAACAGIPTEWIENKAALPLAELKAEVDAEAVALRQQVADLRAASDALSDALMRDWNRSTKESSERVVATWKRLTEVLGATQPQEVQP